MRIEFVIDELVLTGFDPRDRHRIADAIETQLAAQVREVSAARFIEHSHRAVTALRAPDIRLATARGRADVKSIGDGVSRSIVTALSGPEAAVRKP